jgi:hypothetical protein
LGSESSQKNEARHYHLCNVIPAFISRWWSSCWRSIRGARKDILTPGLDPKPHNPITVINRTPNSGAVLSREIRLLISQDLIFENRITGERAGEEDSRLRKFCALRIVFVWCMTLCILAGIFIAVKNFYLNMARRREAHHSLPASVEVKKMWIYTSTPHTPSWRSP